MRFTLEPDTDNTVDVMVFSDVQNAPAIRAKMLKGQIPAALVKAQLIVDVFQILVAVSAALHNKRHDAMHTRNVFTEIVYSLSATRNISKALQRFGITDDTTCFLVIAPNATAAQLADIRDLIQGTEQSTVPQAIKNATDMQQVIKLYDITKEETGKGSVLDSIVTRMACRDVR